MAKIYNTTLSSLIQELEQARIEVGDDITVSVHGDECVDVRVATHHVSLVGFHRKRVSEPVSAATAPETVG